MALPLLLYISGPTFMFHFQYPRENIEICLALISDLIKKEFLQKKRVEKSAFFSSWYGEEKWLGEYFREKTDPVPLYKRRPRIGLVSKSAPALLLVAQPGFRKTVCLFFNIRDKFPQTNFAVFFFFLSFLPSFQTSL